MTTTTWIDPLTIHIDHRLLMRSDFDARTSFDAALKDAIRVKGFDAQKPITVTTIEGKVYLVEGYRRLQAAVELKREGALTGARVCVRFIPNTAEDIVTAQFVQVVGQFANN